VLAAGDIAFADHAVAGRPLRVEHWGDADTQGAVAGAVAAGGGERWSDPPGFWSTIGDRTLKYTAWGDGHDSAEMDGGEASWTVTYRRDGDVVGVLTHEDDAAYERGQELLRQHARGS
jgi:3-phenylpropionate/trans-cinnamate dioxygenase ferredoxin reductase subunit